MSSFWQKIVGAGGWLLGTGAAVYHVINPAMVSEKALPFYVGLGALLALFGKQPTAQSDAPTTGAK